MTKHRAHGLAEHYKLRVYKMLRAWQKRLLDNKKIVQYDITGSGNHEINLSAGIYDIWLVGAGGGSALSVANNVKHYANGGVGGVICARVNVPTDTTVTVTIGAGGASRMSFGGSAVADAGGQTTITGLQGVTMHAGAGTGASANLSNLSAGIQGTNSATGQNVLSIRENNVNTIISETGISSASSKADQPQANTNWTENVNAGAGGNYSWTATNPVHYRGRYGSNGIARIKSV